MTVSTPVNTVLRCLPLPSLQRRHFHLERVICVTLWPTDCLLLHLQAQPVRDRADPVDVGEHLMADEAWGDDLDGGWRETAGC